MFWPKETYYASCSTHTTVLGKNMLAIVKDLFSFPFQGFHFKSFLSAKTPYWSSFSSYAFCCSTLGSDGSPIPSLASSQSTWGILRQSLKGLSVEFALLADKGAQQVQSSFTVYVPPALLCYCQTLPACKT